MFTPRSRKKTVNGAKRAYHSTKKAYHSTKNWVKNAGVGFWFLVFFVFMIVGFFFFDLSKFVSSTVLQYGLIAIFIFSFILDSMVQPIGPDIPLITGIMLGMEWYIVLLIVLIASYSALTMTYNIGKYLGEPGIEKILGKKRWGKIKENKAVGKWALFIGSISPVPYIPYLAGLYKFSIGQTILYVALPRSIRFTIVAIATVYLGDFVVQAFGVMM